MRILKRLVFLLLAVCVVLFALLNPHEVRLNLLLMPTGFRLPLSLLLTGVFLTGFLFGIGAVLLRKGSGNNKHHKPSMPESEQETKQETKKKTKEEA